MKEQYVKNKKNYMIGKATTYICIFRQSYTFQRKDIPKPKNYIFNILWCTNVGFIRLFKIWNDRKNLCPALVELSRSFIFSDFAQAEFHVRNKMIFETT